MDLRHEQPATVLDPVVRCVGDDHRIPEFTGLEQQIVGAVIDLPNNSPLLLFVLQIDESVEPSEEGSTK